MQSPPAPEPYASPNRSEDSQSSRCSLAAQKRRIHNRLLLCVLACFTVLPTLLGRLVLQLPTPGLRWLGYLAATGIVIVSYLAICNQVPICGYGKLKTALASHLEAEGFDLSEATFIGLSPGSEPKIYEGCSNWDIGFLFLQKNALYYVGEQTRFAIPAAQITRVAATIDTASLPAQGALFIAWQSLNPSVRSLQFQMLSAKSVRGTVESARSLQAKVENWIDRQQTTPPESDPLVDSLLAALRPPSIQGVTGQPLSPFSLSTSLLFLIILWVVATGVAFIAGSYLQAKEFIYLMPVVGIVLQAIPSIRRDQQQRIYGKEDNSDRILSRI